MDTARELEERTVARKHVLGMFRVATPPGLVRNFVDFSAAVVPLVKRYGNEAFLRSGAAVSHSGVPVADGGVGKGLHAGFRLQAWVEEP